MNEHRWTTGSARRERRIARRSLALLAACGAFAGAGAVGAAPFERGRFHDVGSEFLEDFCGDLDMLHSFDVSGSFLGLARGNDGLIYFRESTRGTDTWTNTATGKSYIGRWTSNSRDRQVTDNGDGTLTIEVQGSGAANWWADGDLVLRDSGMVRFEILIDHAGTPTVPDDDVFLELLGDTFGSTGRNDLEGRDFCEDLHIFTS